MNFCDFSRCRPVDLNVPYFDAFFRCSNGFSFWRPQRSSVRSAEHALDNDPLWMPDGPLHLQLNVWKASYVMEHILGTSLTPLQALRIGWRKQSDIITHESGAPDYIVSVVCFDY